MEHAMSIALGLGLAAACGFRIFLPFLVMSAAARLGYLELSGGFEWIGSTSALVAFSTATLLEVGAYYIPWLDNALDVIATPVSVVAGVLATASQIGDMDPLLGWSVALIGGGGLAAGTQTVTAVTRQVSTLATGGLTNFVVATLEGVASVALSILALAVPLVAAVAALAFVATALIVVRRRRRAAP